MKLISFACYTTLRVNHSTVAASRTQRTRSTLCFDIPQTWEKIHKRKRSNTSAIRISNRMKYGNKNFMRNTARSWLKKKKSTKSQRVTFRSVKQIRVQAHKQMSKRDSIIGRCGNSLIVGTSWNFSGCIDTLDVDSGCVPMFTASVENL